MQSLHSCAHESGHIIEKGTYMKKFLIVMAAALLALASCHRAPSADGWFSDLDSAKKVARAQNKDILMLISGKQHGISNASLNAIWRSAQTDESGEYGDLQERVENMVAFLISMKAEITDIIVSKLKEDYDEDFVLVRYDEDSKDVADILNLYQVMAEPVLLVLAKDGYCVREFDFDGLERIAYARHPDSPLWTTDLRESRTAIAEYSALLAIAEDAAQDKEKRIQAIQDIFSMTDERFLMPLESLAKKALRLDPQNESGRIADFYCFAADIQASRYLQERKILKAAHLYEKTAASAILTDEQKQEFYYAAAICFSNELNPDYKRAMSALQKGIEVNPGSEQAAIIQSQIDYIKALQERAAQGGLNADDGQAEGPDLPSQE